MMPSLSRQLGSMMDPVPSRRTGISKKAWQRRRARILEEKERAQQAGASSKELFSLQDRELRSDVRAHGGRRYPSGYHYPPETQMDRIRTRIKKRRKTQ